VRWVRGFPPPGKGLRFAHAMLRYGDEAGVMKYGQLAARGLLKEGTPGALTDAERLARTNSRLALVSSMVFRLHADGRYRATGFLLGTNTEWNVPAGWWQDVEVDLESNFASGHGSVVSGLLIYADEEQPAPAEAPEAATQLKPRVEAGSSPALKKRRGRRALKQPAVEEKMLDDLAHGKFTPETLWALSDKQLEAEYKVSAYTANRALRRVTR
jgi:hypothetical protein